MEFELNQKEINGPHFRSGMRTIQIILYKVLFHCMKLKRFLHQMVVAH